MKRLARVFRGADCLRLPLYGVQRLMDSLRSLHDPWANWTASRHDAIVC
jgi:hypothetical protein